MMRITSAGLEVQATEVFAWVTTGVMVGVWITVSVGIKVGDGDPPFSGAGVLGPDVAVNSSLSGLAVSKGVGIGEPYS